MEFRELNLHPDLQKGIEEAGYAACMPVQEQVLTHAFGGQDLYVQSQTGTGKTAAFLVVIFQRLLTEDLLAGKKAIIMVPTRELAVQVEEEAKLLGKYLPFKIGSFYGGVGYTQQQQLLRDNVQILVGTPGRVLDLNKSGRMNLMDIAFLVLDEADRMFDMGFYPDLRKLIKVVPPADRRQTMLFSATLNAWVKNLAWEYTKTPFEIEIAPETVTVEEVEQVLYHVPSEDKMRVLLGILAREKPESAIIFCNTKRYTEIVAKRLQINGYDCEFIIGDLPQSRRLKIIDDVKAGRIRFLAATDVAARGLDIEGLSMVVNYDLPVEAENYVHRIGRTARAGKTGKAVTLSSEQDVYELPAIERYIGKKIPAEILGEELRIEDKSAGMNIRSEIYEERFPRSGDHRGARQGRFRQDGKPRGERHGERGRPPDRGRRPDDGRIDRPREHGRVREEGSRPQNRRPETRRNESPRRETEEGAQYLSRLSSEERMAFYRRKYGPGGQAPGREGAANRGPGSERGQTRRTGGKNHGRKDGRGKSAALDSQNENKRRGRGAGSEQGASGRNVPKERNGAIQTEGPKKGGILSRLAGLFKKN
ncbi:MAG: DEAD/DEAH box helicase [Treponema sp.]|jgi:ATP-dependent RNA helicase RhlB|nr:DEAD/DEAH box helicase [Treponema sp.]